MTSIFNELPENLKQLIDKQTEPIIDAADALAGMVDDPVKIYRTEYINFLKDAGAIILNLQKELEAWKKRANTLQ